MVKMDTGSTLAILVFSSAAFTLRRALRLDEDESIMDGLSPSVTAADLDATLDEVQASNEHDAISLTLPVSSFFSLSEASNFEVTSEDVEYGVNDSEVLENHVGSNMTTRYKLISHLPADDCDCVARHCDGYYRKDGLRLLRCFTRGACRSGKQSISKCPGRYIGVNPRDHPIEGMHQGTCKGACKNENCSERYQNPSETECKAYAILYKRKINSGAYRNYPRGCVAEYEHTTRRFSRVIFNTIPDSHPCNCISMVYTPPSGIDQIFPAEITWNAERCFTRGNCGQKMHSTVNRPYATINLRGDGGAIPLVRPNAFQKLVCLK